MSTTATVEQTRQSSAGSANRGARPFDQARVEAIQQRVIEGASIALESGRNALVIGGTGTGKTRVLSITTAKLHTATGGRPSLFLVPTTALRDQAVNEVAKWTGLSAARLGTPEAETAAVLVATYQDGLIRARSGRMEAPGGRSFALVVIDESHHSSRCGEQIRRVLETARAREPQLLVLGATATPDRHDGAQLVGELAEARRFEMKTWEMMEAGKLAPPMSYVDPPLIGGIDTLPNALARRPLKTGDNQEMEELRRFYGERIRAFRPSSFAEDAVEKWSRVASDRKTIVFAEDIDEAEALGRAFKARGVATGVVSSRADHKPYNDAHLDDFREGRKQVIISVNMISEGFDVPEADCALVTKAAPTRAENLQIAGRVMRAAPDKQHGLVMYVGSAAPYIFGTPESQHALQAWMDGAWRTPDGGQAAPVAPFNPWKRLGLKRSSGERIEAFAGTFGADTYLAVRRKDRDWAILRVTPATKAQIGSPAKPAIYAPVGRAQDSAGLNLFVRQQVAAHADAIAARNFNHISGDGSWVTGPAMLDSKARTEGIAARWKEIEAIAEAVPARTSNNLSKIRSLRDETMVALGRSKPPGPSAATNRTSVATISP